MRRKYNDSIKVGESSAVSLLFSILLLAILLLTTYVFDVVNTRGDTNVSYSNKDECFYITQQDIDDTVFLADHWSIIPNARIQDINSKTRISDLKKLSHIDDISITRNGLESYFSTAYHDTFDSKVNLADFYHFGMISNSVAYTTTIILDPSINNVVLDLGQNNGHIYVYCNGHFTAESGDHDRYSMIPRFSGGNNSITIQNTDEKIELIIIVYSSIRTVSPGLVTTPTLLSSSTYSYITTLPMAWISIIMFFTILVLSVGNAMRKSFEDGRTFCFFTFALINIMIFIAIEGDLFSFVSMNRNAILYATIISTTVFSFCFLSSLYETGDYGSLDSIIIAALGSILLSLGLLDGRLAVGLYSQITMLVFMMITFIISAYKIFLKKIDPRNLVIRNCGIIAFLFILLSMLYSQQTLYNISVTSLYYFISLVGLCIFFVYRYMTQYYEMRSTSSHLKTIVADKTRSISMINKDLYNKNQRLIEMEDARKSVMSNVSHDLKTPITAIRGYTTLLLQTPNMPQEQRETYIMNIQKRSMQMERIVSDIVEISKMESTGFQFNFMDVSINELLDEMDMLFSSDLPSTKRIILTLPEDDILIVKADPKRISRVFENLISNAINYTKEEATIEIKAWRANPELDLSQQEIIITVSDDGIGIPQDEIEHIFDRFYRARNSGQNIKGTGLGLAIVKMIVDKHDATIEVKSELGRGTTFIVKMKPTY